MTHSHMLIVLVTSWDALASTFPFGHAICNFAHELYQPSSLSFSLPQIGQDSNQDQPSSLLRLSGCYHLAKFCLTNNDIHICTFFAKITFEFIPIWVVYLGWCNFPAWCSPLHFRSNFRSPEGGYPPNRKWCLPEHATLYPLYPVIKYIYRVLLEVLSQAG